MIPDYDSYLSRLASSWQAMSFSKGSIATVAGKMWSTWLATGMPAAGAPPTTAAVCTRATLGGLGQFNSSAIQRILRIVGQMSPPSGGTLIIADRVAHAGGMGASFTANSNGTVDSTSRYPTGVGVLAAFEVYSTIGTTAVTATAQAATDWTLTANTTPAIPFGGTGNRENGRSMMIPLPYPARGFKNITQCNLSASTGANGAYGYTLFYPLIQIPLAQPIDGEPSQYEALWEFGGWFPTIPADACLSAYVITNAATMNLLNANIQIAED